MSVFRIGLIANDTKPAAADVTLGAFHGDRGILFDTRTGFVHALLTDADRAGHDRALRLFARLEIAAGDKELVEALFGGGHFVARKETAKWLESESFSTETHRPPCPKKIYAKRSRK